MSVRTHGFRQADVTRAMKGALAAGAKLARIEVDREGKIVIVIGESQTIPAEETPLQRWKRENGPG